VALTVITGPPAAGKTTWALARAKPGDIVIDYDRLAVALTAEGSDTHNHGRLIKRVTYKAWRAAIREAIDLADRCDVYLIHAIPDPDALARYTQAGADIVTIDPGCDAVMARIAGQRPADVARAAERWYATTQAHTTRTTPQASRQW
jgi:hypothetical protein